MGYPPEILLEAVANGLLMGAVYGLVALGLTLVYGVLHIINFAHGALLTLAMYGAFVAHGAFGLDPYAAMVLLAGLFFVLGYLVQRLVIGPASRGDDSNMLLVTLGLSIIIENAMLAIFRSDTMTIRLPYAMSMVELGDVLLSVPRLIGFGVTLLMALLLFVLMTRTDTGRAIRAVAKERTAAVLLCLATRGQCLCTGGFHHSRARRHGQRYGGAIGWAIHRRGGKPFWSLFRR